MITPLLTALASGLAALGLTRWVHAVAAVDSPWLRLRTHVPLAVLGGAGAAMLATTWVELGTFAVLALALAVLVAIDLAAHRLPDVIVGPMYPVLLAGLVLAAAVGGDWSRLGRAAAAGAVLLVGYFVLAFISPSGLGLGDVKLAGLLGGFLGWLGWSHVLLGTLAAFVLGGLAAGVLLVAGRASRDSDVAFGPWMVAGAVVGVVWGPAVLG